MIRDPAMSTSTTENWLPAAKAIELEPTMHQAVGQPWVDRGTGSHRSGRPVAIVEGSLASFTGEMDTLRRRRLLASSVFLTVTFGFLLVWVFASDNPGTLTVEGSRYSLRVGLIALRCLLAAAVAGLVAGELPLSHRQLRVTEYVLFLGMTILIVASQYFVGRDLMRRGPDYTPIALAFIKDGVIEMLALMMIYGTLIPNPPAVAIPVLVAMFVGPVAGALLLELHPDAAAVVVRLSAAEEAGSNILFLGMGSALAIYGSFLLNGLRSQLHKAREFGQYRLLSKLGEGGMGEVHLAEHSLLKRPCALKLIKPETGADPIALARFAREVQSAARLAHPNTIDIYDYGHTDDGTFYYVMEYLRGLALSDLVEKFGPVPPGRVIYLFRQVCAALAEAHGLGLVHRDLKPANVFVAVRGGESDVAKVLDFGLVKLTRDPGAAALTGEMTVSGTPLYMAPEQAVGDPGLDARADLYALGAMMYDALTGQPPFEGRTALAVLMAHGRDPVVPPSQIRPGLPKTSSAWCSSAWPKSPTSVIAASRSWARRWPHAPARSIGMLKKRIAGGPSTECRSQSTRHRPRPDLGLETHLGETVPAFQSDAVPVADDFGYQLAMPGGFVRRHSGVTRSPL
jgi:serine/threonine-protein kinase